MGVCESIGSSGRLLGPSSLPFLTIEFVQVDPLGTRLLFEGAKPLGEHVGTRSQCVLGVDAQSAGQGHDGEEQVAHRLLDLPGDRCSARGAVSRRRWRRS